MAAEGANHSLGWVACFLLIATVGRLAATGLLSAKQVKESTYDQNNY